MSTQIAVRAACDAVGGQAALARMVGVTPSMVQQWRQGVRPLSDDRSYEIERVTAGQVTVEALSPPAARWVRVPDAAWPHPAGRPLLDLARQPEPAQEGA
jgi:DNA-binding transcriptional regulator YdaS (Cro superfamily)